MIEKESGIHARIIKNQDLVLISNNVTFINHKNLSSKEISSIAKASDSGSGLCSRISDNLLTLFWVFPSSNNSVSEFLELDI